MEKDYLTFTSLSPELICIIGLKCYKISHVTFMSYTKLSKYIYCTSKSFVLGSYRKVELDSFVRLFIRKYFRKLPNGFSSLVFVGGSYIMSKVYDCSYNDIDIFISDNKKSESEFDIFSSDAEHLLVDESVPISTLTTSYSNLAGINKAECIEDNERKFNIIFCNDVMKTLRQFDFTNLMVFYRVYPSEQLLVKYPVTKHCHLSRSLYTTLLQILIDGSDCLTPRNVSSRDVPLQIYPKPIIYFILYKAIFSNYSSYYTPEIDNQFHEILHMERMMERFRKYKRKGFIFGFELEDFVIKCFIHLSDFLLNCDVHEIKDSETILSWDTIEKIHTIPDEKVRVIKDIGEKLIHIDGKIELRPHDNDLYGWYHKYIEQCRQLDIPLNEEECFVPLLNDIKEKINKESGGTKNRVYWSKKEVDRLLTQLEKIKFKTN